jgi:hypothetical protein
VTHVSVAARFDTPLNLAGSIVYDNIAAIHRQAASCLWTARLSSRPRFSWGDPINRSDPTGMFPFSPLAGIISALDALNGSKGA